MDNIRIAVLGTRGFPNIQGGIERHCEELYTRLFKKGCKIRVYARKGYVNSEQINYKGVNIFPLWSPKLKSLEAITHTFLGIIHIALRRKDFDIIHIHGIGPSLLIFLIRLLGLKVVVTNHGPDYNRQKWGIFAKYMLLCGESNGTRFASAVISVSKNIKKVLKEKYNRDSYYIPNGVSFPQKVPPGSTLEKHKLKAGKYILAVGRLVPEKGFHDLLDVYKELNTDWKLVIAGGSYHEDNYSRFINNKAKDNKGVVMTGIISGKTLSEIYSNAGLFILPSYHEGLPITILEAIAYSIPILASDIPAIREVPIDGNCTFPPGDKMQMRKKLSQFINDSVEREKFSINKKRIEKEFNWNRIADKTFLLYAKICNKQTRLDNHENTFSK